MHSKLKHMLGIWMENGLVVQLTLSNGDIIAGRLKETDADEVILVPDIDGQPGPLTVVQLAHVMTATYLDESEI